MQHLRIDFQKGTKFICGNKTPLLSKQKALSDNFLAGKLGYNMDLGGASEP